MSDRLYVIERLGGKFQVDGGIWQENSTGRADRVGEITKVHDDHIIGRVKHSGKQMRFSFVGGRFDDVDGDISQAIEKIVEQPAQPQPDRLYVVEDAVDAIEKSYTGGFSCNGFIWKEDPEGGDPEYVGKVKEVHSNYILGRLDDSDEYVRFDFVGERFKDVDEEPSQEIVRHAAAAFSMQDLGIDLKFPPAQPEITVGQYAFEDGKFFGEVVKGDNEHIRIDGLDDYKCWFSVSNETRQRFKFFSIKPGMWLAPKTLIGVHKLIERIDTFGDTKFPIVVMEDGGSIYFDGAIKYYDILTQKQHDEVLRSSRSVKGFTEPTAPAQPQSIPLLSADKWNEILKPAPLLGPDKYDLAGRTPKFGQFVFKDGECLGTVKDDRWFVDRDDCMRAIGAVERDEFKFLTIEPGMVIGHKIGIGQSTCTIGAVSLGNGNVEPHLVTHCNHLIKLSDFAANWIVSGLTQTEPAQPQSPLVVVGSRFYKHGKFWCEVTSLEIVDGELVGDVKYSDGSPQILKGPVKISIYTDDPNMECRPPAQQPAQPVAVPTVYDEYGLVIYLGFDVFYKQTGEVLGKITELHENNQITMEFTPGVTDDTVVQKKNTIPCYDPRFQKGVDPQWGFCPSNWGTSNADRILRIDRFEGRTAHKLSPVQLSKRISEIAQTVLPKYLSAQKPAQPQPEPQSETKQYCPRCESLNKWQPSVYPEHTDFCAACNIWWTSGNRSKPIVDSKDLEPSMASILLPTQPAHAKLKECGVSDTEAWINRNRPPVELHNGDTIVTNDGIYRLHDNKWVKVAGKLRVRSHESTVDDSRNVVEYKFVSDPLPIKERNKHFKDAVATVREILEWGDHMSDLRPKGKPISLARSLGQATARSLNELIRKQIDREVTAEILKENSQRNEDS